MKKLIMAWALLLSADLVQSQSLSQQSIGSAAGKGNTGALYFEWSVAEMIAVNTENSSSVMLSQGFLQPDAAYAFPVTLIYFTGKAAPGQNELHWATSEETNNSHFEVEKSGDGIHFGLLDRVTGSGNHYTQKTYSALDINPYLHTYYRLKQVDYDGTHTFSSIIYIKQVTDNRFALYPNPTSGPLYLSVKNSRAPLQITIFDLSGIPVSQHTSGPADVIRLETDLLPVGSYVIRVAEPVSGTRWSAVFLKL